MMAANKAMTRADTPIPIANSETIVTRSFRVNIRSHCGSSPEFTQSVNLINRVNHRSNLHSDVRECEQEPLVADGGVSLGDGNSRFCEGIGGRLDHAAEDRALCGGGGDGDA